MVMSKILHMQTKLPSPYQPCNIKPKQHDSEALVIYSYRCFTFNICRLPFIPFVKQKVLRKVTLVIKFQGLANHTLG